MVVDKDEFINMRIDPDLKASIQKLVDAKEYNNITDFVTKAIDEKLNPEKRRNRMHADLLELLKDPEIRKELSLQ